LDKLFISEILPRCGDWHDSFNADYSHDVTPLICSAIHFLSTNAEKRDKEAKTLRDVLKNEIDRSKDQGM
jgi:hypothetical protein